MKHDEINDEVTCIKCCHHDVCKVMNEFPRYMFSRKMEFVMISLANACNYYKHEKWSFEE